MTFTQKSGNPVSFIGTEGVDTLVLTNGVVISGVTDASGIWEGGPAFIQGLGNNDIVTINGNATGVTIEGGDGQDQIVLDAGTEAAGGIGQFTNGQVLAGLGDDDLFFENLVSSGLYGNEGDDYIFASQFATSVGASVNGNQGDDFLSFRGRAGDTGFYGGQGDDYIGLDTDENFITSSVINGNKGRDFIDIFSGGALSGAWTGTEVRGGADDDEIFVNGDADILQNSDGVGGIYGDKGNDYIALGTNFSDADNFVSGGEGNDLLFGYNTVGDNTFEGNEGNDIINLSAPSFFTRGNDTVIGGVGNDSYISHGNGDVNPFDADAGSVTYIQGDADSTAATLVKNKGVDGIFDDGDYIQYQNGIDIITLASSFFDGDGINIEAYNTLVETSNGLIDGGQLVAGIFPGFVQDGFGESITNGLTSNTTWYFTGNYDASANVFTLEDDGGLFSDVLVVGNGNNSTLNTNSSAFVIENVFATV